MHKGCYIWLLSVTACDTTITDLSTADTLAGLHSYQQPRPITQNLKGVNTHDYRN